MIIKKNIILPKAQYDLMRLRLQDFELVNNFTSALFKTCSKLLLYWEKITDEDMLENTFSIFHISNMLLQQRYQERGFKKYYELISCLLVTEQHNELLMKNHKSRPTRATTFSKANVILSNNHGWGRGHDRGRNNSTFRGNNHSNFKKTTHDES